MPGVARACASCAERPPALREIDDLTHCPFFGVRRFGCEVSVLADDPCLMSPTTRWQRTGGKKW